MTKDISKDVIKLLKELIAIQSFSREEDKTADLIADFLSKGGVELNRAGNNVWTILGSDEAKPLVLLNSHHDTVKPNNGWTKDPFKAVVEEGKLYGLGSNDAGGSLVSLLAAFLCLRKQGELNFRLAYSATAEEEVSGRGGVESILPQLGAVDLAIVGEPTEMHPAVAEKGLLVLDCTAHGVAGHAARSIGKNAILKAIPDIHWFHSYQFPRESQFLGPVKMSVTMIEAGSQHNVIPDACRFTVDIRTTDVWSNSDVLGVVRQHVGCDVKPRSTRLDSSALPPGHPAQRAISNLNLQPFGSPTCSDQGLIPFPSLKMGPGRSERSHTADEFIYLDEIEQGIVGYIEFLEELNQVW
ncbi:MAG: M20 family metallo-hydrolase [Calditrichia bacterium]